MCPMYLFSVLNFAWKLETVVKNKICSLKIHNKSLNIKELNIVYHVTYFLSCRPRLKPSLLEGWNTSTDGSKGR